MRSPGFRTAVFALAAAAFLRGGGVAAGPAAAPRDAFLANLAGKWTLTRKIRGAEVRNTVDAEWVLDGRFLEVHMRDAAEPPTYEAIVLMGFDPASGRYVAHWCDTYGAGYSAIGRGKRAGDSVELEFAYPDAPFYNTFTWHPERSEWTCLLENVRGGRRVVFAEDVLRRP